MVMFLLNKKLNLIYQFQIYHNWLKTLGML